MRRSLCICEPSFCLTGDVQTFKFIYTPATTLPKGAKLRFDMASKGRQIDWEIPQVNPKEKTNLIWAELPDGKPLYAKAIDRPTCLVPLYEFVLTSEIKAGDNFTILMGSPLKNKESGSRAQTVVQRRKPFHLFIDPKGKNDFKEQEIFHFDIRGNVLENIRIITPSIVSKNKRFDVIVRFEDRYGNLTSNAPEKTLIELSYENLRENLNWKLFIPETGFINLPNLYFNEVGIYRIKLQNTGTKTAFFSAPIKCLPETTLSLFWGLLHGESDKFDSSEQIESCFRSFRDDRALQFYGLSSFESTEETPNELWKSSIQYATEFNEEHRFCSFLGFQYEGEESGEGLRHIVYFKDNKPLVRKKESKTTSLSKLYKTISPKDALSIPCFTMGKGHHSTFSEFDPEFEKVVEIYNAWGSSECLAKQGNTRPIRSTTKEGVQETEEGSVVSALLKNHRFGFIAGGLDDRGIYSGFYEGGQVQYSPGLTAILATAQTKEALMQALQNRSCYATTGERMILGLSIAGSPMGTELTTKTKPGLAISRHIVAYIAGTTPLKEIVLLRNGKPFKTFHTKDYHLDLELDDIDPLPQICLPGGEGKSPFIFYYLRVTQEDGHIAWSSPIWVDYSDTGVKTLPEVKKTPLKKK